MKTNIHFWSYLPQFLEYKCFRKSCIENQNIFFMWNNLFFETRAVYEIMWKNIVDPGRATIRRMRMAYWLSKATHTHSEYVVLATFHCNYGYTNTPQCYVIRTLPVLFSQTLVRNCARLGYYAAGGTRRVTTQKSAVFSYFAGEAWNPRIGKEV